MKTIRLTVIIEQLHETKANSCQKIYGVVGCITPKINYISNGIQKQKLEIAIVDSVDPTAIARVKCYNTNLFNLLVAGKGIIMRNTLLCDNCFIAATLSTTTRLAHFNLRQEVEANCVDFFNDNATFNRPDKTWQRLINANATIKEVKNLYLIFNFK